MKEITNYIRNGSFSAETVPFSDFLPYWFIGRRINAGNSMLPEWECVQGAAKIITESFWLHACNTRRLQPPQSIQTAAELYTFCKPSALAQRVCLPAGRAVMQFAMLFNPYGTCSQVCGGVTVTLTADDGSMQERHFDASSAGERLPGWIRQIAEFQVTAGNYQIALKNRVVDELANNCAVFVTDVSMGVHTVS